MTKYWKDLKKERLSEEKLNQIQQKVEEEIVAINLKNLRQLLGKTQVETALKAQMSQGEISRLEGRSDHLISTLQHYVHALGGELEITAIFSDKRITMKGI